MVNVKTPNSQFEIWSNPGPEDSAKRTHRSVREALKHRDSPLMKKEKSFDIFLQGSYQNTTNIHGNSDVDIVVKLEDTFISDKTDLSDDERSRHEDQYTDSDYNWSNFREDVLTTLRKYYSRGSINESNKAIELEHDSLPIDADILVCLEFRDYNSFYQAPGDYEEGIVFWPLQGNERITNFPKQHIEKGAEKHSDTKNRYKETVRIFKHVRKHIVKNYNFDKDRAPSYFIECMLYNVPNRKFCYNKKERFENILEWLQGANLREFQCQNELKELFGDKSTQWYVYDAKEFLKKAERLAREWE